MILSLYEEKICDEMKIPVQVLEVVKNFGGHATSLVPKREDLSVDRKWVHESKSRQQEQLHLLESVCANIPELEPVFRDKMEYLKRPTLQEYLAMESLDALTHTLVSLQRYIPFVYQEFGIIAAEPYEQIELIERIIPALNNLSIKEQVEILDARYKETTLKENIKKNFEVQFFIPADGGNEKFMRELQNSAQEGMKVQIPPFLFMDSAQSFMRIVNPKIYEYGFKLESRSVDRLTDYYFDEPDANERKVFLENLGFQCTLTSKRIAEVEVDLTKGIPDYFHNFAELVTVGEKKWIILSKSRIEVDSYRARIALTKA